MRRTPSTFADFEDGGKCPQAKEFEQPLESGKDKEMDSPPESSERHAGQ